MSTYNNIIDIGYCRNGTTCLNTLLHNCDTGDPIGRKEVIDGEKHTYEYVIPLYGNIRYKDSNGRKIAVVPLLRGRDTMVIVCSLSDNEISQSKTKLLNMMNRDSLPDSINGIYAISASEIRRLITTGSAYLMTETDGSTSSLLIVDTSYSCGVPATIGPMLCGLCNGSGSIFAKTYKRILGIKFPWFKDKKECPRCEGDGILHPNKKHSTTEGELATFFAGH